MNIHTLIKRIENGEIKIEKGGHVFSTDIIFEGLLRNLNFQINYHTDKLDDSDYHKKVLDEINSKDAYTPGKKWMQGFDNTELHCRNCGGRGLHFRFKDENTLEIFHWKSKEVVDCPIEDGPYKMKINVPSGKLVFANYFDNIEDAAEDDKYTEEYSLNNLIGRINIAKYLSKQNFGYGQMGNTSVSIYISHDKKSIKVIDGYTEDDAEEYEHCLEEYPEDITESWTKRYNAYKELKKTHVFVDTLCLCVWRWMCCDESLVEAASPSNECMDAIDVEPGQWEVTHNYDHDRDAIFASEMRLI